MRAAKILNKGTPIYSQSFIGSNTWLTPNIFRMKTIRKTLNLTTGLIAWNGSLIRKTKAIWLSLRKHHWHPNKERRLRSKQLFKGWSKIWKVWTESRKRCLSRSGQTLGFKNSWIFSSLHCQITSSFDSTKTATFCSIMVLKRSKSETMF